MPTCDYCGEEVTLPYTCGYCGGSFCSKHRLPENHDCEGLEKISKKFREEGRIYRDVGRPKQGREEEERPAPLSRGAIFRIGKESEGERRERRPDREPPGLFRGLLSIFKSIFLKRATLILLLLMFSVFMVQTGAHAVLGAGYYQPEDPSHPSADFDTFLYYLAPSRSTLLTRPWTIVTGIFAHGYFLHFFINGLVLFFIGSALERRIGREKFIYLFLTAGILSSIAQILVIPNETFVALGVSGAIFGVLGALTVIAPRLPILLFFFIPMPIWILTCGFGIWTVISALTGFAKGIGHMAHFSGLLIGLAYGYKLRKEVRRRRRPSPFDIFGR
ncbi:hypothetical protein AKJ63_00380 [candidate division MSBL1 archaeon SCGC-AAA259D18]|uniref:AN1-type domain-containing protein n=1 Tax=candidate division MSBL1 archaeon SCGC-AAA259D18 TaxID=1698262 RepID=A0A133UCK9_9EURY|nr:hypothetical protein AKJ63_00380 [candidate division MSBL1 archaeon SCGC-AAA259D18]